MKPGTNVIASFVPEDTQVLVHTYSLHRNPQEFSPLPDTFWPDRWLVQDSYILPSGETAFTGDVRTSREAFVPFSMGPMVCAGKNVALAEIRAVICAMVQRFDIAAVDVGSLDKWEGDLEDFFVSKIGQLPVKLSLRPTAAASVTDSS